ncbi:serine hydrolase [Caproiciproducens galactitolivorans]|uniref:Class A beta-lactamase-related serine hydrolase n=1 Tax=Caproiciproducens galactitolivorans TaxID=642589 RepID=A0ABT4BTG4_9FIRM|nr:serine hydrolase [Caproiciproducens galactitolivorans]MCY1713620.1 class A beta-lactamase-related serine hydrolase [Caproiciproducens galactitolivorans]
MKEKILSMLREIPGKTGFYYKDLITGEEWGLNADRELMAASVIKIPVLTEVFAQLAAGTADKNERFRIRKEDKLPSCGALNYLHEGLEVTLEDLYTLMIILSDNTATNLLIRRFGMEAVNRRMRGLGLKATTLNRLLFDSEAAAKGLENMISAKEIGFLLEQMYRGELVSPAASAEMLSVLKNQRLNGKMPFYLKGKAEIAHKTGEDDGITHDVGIIFAPRPFVVCFCSNETDVPCFERAIQGIAKLLYDMHS